MPKNKLYFSKILITWYLRNKRELPWRQTQDPYKIWLSEIILQQTRVAQGLPYYTAFVKTYPTVHHLAKAPEEEVLKLWQGLGYYSRARNLLFTAKIVANELKGEFPDNYAYLKKLKGVGDYTASAIASICFNEPAAVVDGNVYRVLARVFNVAIPINSTHGIKYFKQLAQELLDPSQPGTYNQAIMEFGARYCVPQNPDCKSCIFNNRCEAFKNDSVAVIPVKLKKLKVKKRYFNYLVFVSDSRETLLEQRKGKGIWQNLYQFPLIETPSKVLKETLVASKEFKAFTENQQEITLSKFNEKPVVHKLSHQHLFTTFWIVEVVSLQQKGVAFSDLKKYPVPVLISNFMEAFKFQDTY